VGELPTDRSQRLALVAFRAFEAVKPRRTVQDDEFDRVDEFLGVLDRLLLFLEGVGRRDDEPRGEFVDRLGLGVGVGRAGGRELLHAFDRQSLGVDEQRRPAVCSYLDRRREDDVGLAGGRRAVDLRGGAALEPAAEQVVDGGTARRNPVGHAIGFGGPR
jgi:hypothetical protein